ncbi:hypothetical protein C8A03DRAFT_33814 [Achaetomium macrosporum]|uniref:Uncharacterized protein n=1 Tax=Achaetomium macrosporum TaxID=79813 RepID=A0AAN7CC02_9PEZI|nr:hypothetical protein C8A03DRAFT_33814 [Achaetomium macrosporum]
MDRPDEPSRDLPCDNDTDTTALSLSINQLVARHARERLLVRPVRWTDRRLSLLRCRFHSQGEGGRAEGMPTAYLKPETSDSDSERQTLYLEHTDNFWDRSRSIDELLGLVSEHRTLNRKYLGSVALYFNQQPCAKFAYKDREIITAQPGRKRIRFALFDMSEPLRQRFQHFKPPWPKNEPVAEHKRRLRKRLAPRDRYRDPYLVAVIIALAQKKRHEAPQQASPPRGFTVRLLILDRDKTSVFQYVAHVQGSFLDMFDHPATQPPSGNPGLDVHCWEIPSSPGSTFAHRLVWALRTDCCGEMHADTAEEATDIGETNDAGEANDSQETDDTEEVDEDSLVLKESMSSCGC